MVEQDHPTQEENQDLFLQGRRRDTIEQQKRNTDEIITEQLRTPVMEQHGSKLATNGRQMGDKGKSW